MRIFEHISDAPCTFTLFVDVEDVIDNVCGGVAMLGFERMALIGRPLSDIFPLVRDVPPRTRMSNNKQQYYLKDNTFLLKDSSFSVESYFVPELEAEHARYRVFNIAHLEL